MQKEHNITIIIPTYTNIKGLTIIINFLKKSGYPIIIIDNHPTKEKKDIALSPSPIVYLPQKKNLGFAKAVNLGVNKSNTDWVLILNDDVIIENIHVIEHLKKIAEKNNWSAVSPVLKNDTNQIENIGYRVLPIGRVELNFEKSPLTPLYQGGKLDFNSQHHGGESNIIDQRYIDGLTAACLLIRKKDFEAVGGFDEGFFAYLEDVDLFLRIKKKGYRFGVDINSDVIHSAHQTSSHMGNFKQRQDLKNWVRIIVKNWDRKMLLRYLPFIILERLRNVSGLVKATIWGK